MSDLDRLYDVALRKSASWRNTGFSQDAHGVLACIVLGRVPIADSTMDIVLSSSPGSSANVLSHLSYVIQWAPGNEVRTLHASFSDYLTDPIRSRGEPWSIDPKAGHLSLASGYFHVLNSELKFNICHLEDSHLLNVEVADMAQ
jgi:hypothetical protein